MASRRTRMAVNLRGLDMIKCQSQKVGFRTKDEALTAAENMMERGQVKPGCHITPYLCADCGDWHVRNRVIVWLPEYRKRKRR